MLEEVVTQRSKGEEAIKPSELDAILYCMNAKNYKFFHKIGPGGIKCPCCADQKDGKKIANRKFRRAAKRAISNEA